MKVIFSDRAYASVLAETTEKVKTETGGLFLGTVVEDTWYIIEAIDPGPKSVFKVAYFEYEQKYTEHLINKIANLYEEKLELIGLWHRHPGSFDIFSTTDNGTNSKYASMRKNGAISALVNIDPHFRITMYHVAYPHKYMKINYSVGNDKIPSKYFAYKSQEHFTKLMTNILENKPSVREKYHVSYSLKSFMKQILPLLEENKLSEKPQKPTAQSEEITNKIIDAVLTDVVFMSDDIGIEMSIIKQTTSVDLVQNTVAGTDKVFFAYSEENDTVIFNYDGNSYCYNDALFSDTFSKVKEQEIPVSDDESNTANNSNRLLDGVLKLIGFDKMG